MSRSIRVIFALHNHQPAGNFDYVFNDACENSYLPLLCCLEKHPGIRMSLHYSGTLLTWLEQNRPEFLEKLRNLVRLGRIELLSGAFYEPVLAGIPETDRIGQITKQNQYLRHSFGVEARGLWLAEKIWEPDLPKSIEQAGLRYTAIDEENFTLNGVSELPVRGYYNTENEGHTLGVFPISRGAGRLLLHSDPEDLLDFLRSRLSDNNQDVVVIADDGEKYRRTDPGGKGCDCISWLDRLFSLLEDNSERIQMNTFREYYDSVPPQGIAYFPSGSFSDMDGWTLHNAQQSRFNELLGSLSNRGDFEAIRPFIRGGIWRNFMTKYHESNWMQKRIQQISRKYRLLEGQVNNKNRLRGIRDSLWLSMCNDVFWHGHFGGIYLPHLRNATWKSIIRAEKEIEDKLYNLKDGAFVHNEADFDRDGHLEIQLSTQKYTAIFSKKYSGALVEFDYKPSEYNLFDSMRRYPEQYHQQIVDNRNLASASDKHKFDRYISNDTVIFDEKPRYGLLDRFFDSKVTVEGLHSNAYEEASDFINETVDICNNNCDRSLVFERRGWINWQRARLKKQVLLDSSGFDVDYFIGNIGIGDNEFCFGPEFNFALHSGEEGEKTLFADVNLKGAGYKDFLDLKSVSSFGFENRKEKVRVTLNFSDPVRLLMYPVETLVRTQQGFEKIYQSTCIVPLWHVALTPGKSVDLKLQFRIEDL